MRSRPSIVRRLWRKVFPAKPDAHAKPASAAPKATSGSVPIGRRPRTSTIESLEGRIAPATLLPGGKAISYQDIDGDLVTITFSKALFTGASDSVINATLSNVFKFTSGSAHTGAADPAKDAPQQLQLIDLTRLLNNGGISIADGLSFTIDAQLANGGDGLANVGYVKALNIALGKVSIDGDLGQIDAGRDGAAVAVQSLHVDSLGKLTNTQFGSVEYESRITGTLAEFQAREVTGAYLHVINGIDLPGHPALAKGNIGTLVITEHLQPRDAANTTITTNGLVQAAGNINFLSIGAGGHLTNTAADGLVGGAGANSGTVFAGGKINTLIVNGDLTGGTGKDSGSVFALKGYGSIRVTGSLVGGNTDQVLTGSITAGKTLSDSATTAPTTGGATSVLIEGKLIGASGDFGGNLVFGGNVGSLTVKSALIGSTGDQSGRVYVGGNLGQLFVGSGVHAAGVAGDGLIGGDGLDAGTITVAGSLGTAFINGDITGGVGIDSAAVSVGKNLTSIEVRGLITGGEGNNSGAVAVAGNIGTVKISRPEGSGAVSGILAGAGDDSGLVSALGSITSANIAGDISGIGELPVGSDSGSIHSGGLSSGGVIRSLVIDGSIVGGAGENLSGFVEALGSLGTVRITGDITGGSVANSGILLSAGGATSVIVEGHLTGGSGVSSGVIAVGQAGTGKLANLQILDGIFGGDGDGSGVVSALSLGTVKVSLTSAGIGDSAIQGGDGDSSGAIRAAGGIDSLTIIGATTGGLGDFSGQVEMHGTLRSLTAGDLRGGQGQASGAILVSDYITDRGLTAGYLGTAHVGDIVGGLGGQSGQLTSAGGMGQVTAGDLLIGNGELSGLLRAGVGATGTGNVASLKLNNLGLPASGSDPAIAGGTVEVSGMLTQFTAANLLSAEVHAGRIGSFTANSVIGSVITAEGGAAANARTDLALGKVTIAHDVISSSIYAGYDLETQPVNGHAQIGAVVVNGNWTASSLVAGIRDAQANDFGDADDTAIASTNGSTLLSKIASLVIKGDVTGTATAGDHFGIVAQQIGAVIVKGQTIQLVNHVAELGGATDDVSVRTVV